MEMSEEFPPIGRKLSILLAEDDKADTILFKDALEELPVKVKFNTVPDGEQLISWLKNKRRKLPDVLFLDLNMPRKNGFAALGEIKRNPDLEKIPVIIFSTANEAEMIKQVFKDAAHYYIRKPTSFSDLKKVIFKVLELIADKNIKLPAREHFILSGDRNLIRGEMDESVQKIFRIEK
jgi:CheY-like chemotaxis protein